MPLACRAPFLPVRIGIAGAGGGDGGCQNDEGDAGGDSQQGAHDEGVRGAVAGEADDDTGQNHDAGADDLTHGHAHTVAEIQLLMAVGWLITHFVSFLCFSVSLYSKKPCFRAYLT